MREEIHDDERDPGHTRDACMRKFSEVTPLFVTDRDPGDEDDIGGFRAVVVLDPGLPANTYNTFYDGRRIR